MLVPAVQQVFGSLAILSLLFPTTIIPSISARQIPLHPDGGAKERVPLENIPSLGLGLWNSEGENATKAIGYAFHAGYRHLDGAAAYGNEQFVGQGLNSSGAPARHKYWVTSKLWNDAHQPKLVRRALEQTLSDLGTPYLDLYLMHWPVAFLPGQAPGRNVLDQDTSVRDTWQAMEELVRANLTRYIGVSNFSPRQLDQLLKDATIKPYAHEFETHPYLQQQEFVQWHVENRIRVIAYSPLANSNPTYDKRYPKLRPILADRFWTELALRKNISAAQAVLGWGVQRGATVIPKSIHEQRVVENLGALNVTFTDEEMAEISAQDKKARFNDPSKSWGVELFEGLDDGSNRFLSQDL